MLPPATLYITHYNTLLPYVFLCYVLDGMIPMAEYTIDCQVARGPARTPTSTSPTTPSPSTNGGPSSSPGPLSARQTQPASPSPGAGAGANKPIPLNVP